MSEDETRRRFLAKTGTLSMVLVAGCTGSRSNATDVSNGEMADGTGDVTDPANAPRTRIDRFSEAAGTLMIRTEENGLPGPNEPIDFDQKPFLTRGLGPDGEMVSYYNFDVQPTDPAPIYALFREGEDAPVEGQLNIIDEIPGDEGYNDFWHVHEVTVPADYEANTATTVQDLRDGGYDIMATEVLKNCPVVPDESTASLRHSEGDTGLVEGWYNDQVVSYFLFEEAPLAVTDGSVPVSPIYVTFNENPGEDGGGPPSGFMTEGGNDQTHNVVATVPDDGGYSPLWTINIYDNADFASVTDLESATEVTLLESDATTVNCPVVSVGME
ncbi:hypothetical protein [Natrinema halophilum]|uniref:Uncharacterized protein n=1 Tax=Natrinema halophilum TaxID=1699371 RepID=A0A7D5KCP9_9EURY|nr:hypothetical protein [Natrinema halophilum]QLG48736.1 hypothetical protein HYG82_07690 [Natrinema halophilum]